MIGEIEKTNESIRTVTGKIPALFRPPYGVTNPNLKQAMQKTGMISVGWSLRTFDTVKSEEKVLNKLKRRTRPGDVVLFHDNDKKLLIIISEYLSFLKEKGFKIVSLASLLQEESYD